MPNTGFQGGLSGLFAGLSAGATEIMKKRNEAEDLYIKLSQDKNLKLKSTARPYKFGMTKVQVLEQFEENENKESASGRILSQDAIDLYIKRGMLEKGTKAGYLTAGDIGNTLRDRSTNVTEAGNILNAQGRAAGLEQDVNKLRTDTLQWMIKLSKDNPTMYNKIMKDSRFRGLRDFFEGKVDSFELSTQSKKVLGIELDKIPGLNQIINTKEEVIATGKPEEPKKDMTSEVNSILNNSSINTEQAIQQIKLIYERNGLDFGAEEEQAIRIKNVGGASQLTPPSAAGTPIEQNISQDLQNPMGTSMQPQPSPVAPNQSNMMLKSIIPQKPQEGFDPNKHVLELARKFRDSLANSPYPVR
jgi:hypothetical protein